MITQAIPVMVRAITVVALFLSITACNNDKKQEPQKESFFPALGFIRSQVADVDTSVYPIIKVTYIDSVRSDTAFIKREEFRAIANDFLTLPDLFQPEYKDRYKEQNGFDGTLNQAFWIYTPKNPEKEIIQEQTVWVKPDASGDKASSIIFSTGITTKDSVVEKRLTWWVDRSFLVYITKQLPGKEEQVINFKVIWNESDQ